MMDSLNSPPPALGSFYTPLVISLVGVFSTCTALLLYNFILIKYCKTRTETAPNDQAAPQDASLPCGVDQKLLQTIPIILYSSTKTQDCDSHLFRLDQSECVVCLGELEHGEFVRLLPNCKHAFHVPCIDEWFMEHTSCPICRSPIVAEALPVNNDASLPPPTLPISSACSDGTNREVELSVSADQDRDQHLTGNHASSSSSGVKGQSFGLLRHCASLALPRERPSSSAPSVTGLKRSLSLDQSSVIIDLQMESGTDGSSSTSSSRTVVSHLDRVSSKFLTSFPRFRWGKNTESLPY